MTSIKPGMAAAGHQTTMVRNASPVCRSHANPRTSACIHELCGREWLTLHNMLCLPASDKPSKTLTCNALLAALLYNLTDEAIRVCPPSTQWVLATNGDNLYAKDAFQAILDAPEDADVVALDYYSRYQRSTGPPCMRFAASSKAPPCKENRYQHS